MQCLEVVAYVITNTSSNFLIKVSVIKSILIDTICKEYEVFDILKNSTVSFNLRKQVMDKIHQRQSILRLSRGIVAKFRAHHN